MITKFLKTTIYLIPLFLFFNIASATTYIPMQDVQIATSGKWTWTDNLDLCDGNNPHIWAYMGYDSSYPNLTDPHGLNLGFDPSWPCANFLEGNWINLSNSNIGDTDGAGGDLNNGDDGYYWISFKLGNTDEWAYFNYKKINGEFFWVYTSDNLDTRILNITPENGTNIATSSIINNTEGATTTLSVDYYINEEDLGLIQSLEVQIKNVDQNWIYGSRFLSEYTFTVVDTPTEGGQFHWEREIWLPYGGYKINTDINTTYLGGIFTNPFGATVNSLTASQDESNPLHQYHLYTIGGNTTISGLQQNINNQLETILSATGTTPSVADCNVLSGFDFGKCMAFAFIPSQEQLNQFGNTLSQGVLYKFPLGYIWSVIDVMSTTTAVAIPSISATMPSALGIGNGSISVGITSGMFDYILFATSSKYANASNGYSTQTFYDFTYYYWRIFVYLGLLIYLMQRILGSHVIGDIWSDVQMTKGDIRRIFKKKS